MDTAREEERMNWEDTVANRRAAAIMEYALRYGMTYEAAERELTGRD